ncbi:metabolite transport [Moniliophthora roreri MCA 2997]|uniref:Metabolite transport n=1 Tax=Moniliophthora roreri (strain MCA 2997) TaxID=1381753 RepID=V2X467_MONRO|nr:metabolite transport [Moniliophthora roreri MCA 2997]
MQSPASDVSTPIKSFKDVSYVAPEVARTEKEEPGRLSSVLNVLVAGVALFSDGYNVQIIGYMNPILSELYPTAATTEMKTRLSNSILVGEIFGMILFGLCIDRWGRKMGIITTTLFLVFGIALATAAHGTTPTGLLWMMIIARGVAGVGAGGEYTVCTTQAIEAADEDTYVQKRRGALVATATNVAIISGFVGSSIAAIIVIAVFNDHASDAVWRTCFGIGVILPLTIFFFRMRLVDSTQYHKHAIKRNFPWKLAIKRYWKAMLGCCGAWFLYDVVVYPFNLLAPTIVSEFTSSSSLVESTGWSALVNSFALPGAVFGGLLIDRLGRRQTYTLGFIVVAISGFIIGGAMIPLRKVFPAFVVLFGVFQSFLSVGPGNCNFLVCSESFPTPIRGHFLGFSAAAGKAGAAVGTQVFPIIMNKFPTIVKGQQAIFLVGSAICVIGAALVWFLVPDMDEQLESEDAKFKKYLEENGYDTSEMGI